MNGLVRQESIYPKRNTGKRMIGLRRSGRMATRIGFEPTISGVTGILTDWDQIHAFQARISGRLPPCLKLS